MSTDDVQSLAHTSPVFIHQAEHTTRFTTVTGMTTTTNTRPPADERVVDGPVDIVPAPYFSKRMEMLGRLTAICLLVICAPIIAVLIVLVRITSRGPALFKQVRVGRDGKNFVMYKLRSMIEDAESETGPVWTQDLNDPRVTSFGRILRKSHLDELPQLFNVARGEMAMFGPRPERPELVRLLAERIPGYLNRLSVRPGITGLAQINLPPDSSPTRVRCSIFECSFGAGYD